MKRDEKIQHDQKEKERGRKREKELKTWLKKNFIVAKKKIEKI